MRFFDGFVLIVLFLTVGGIVYLALTSPDEEHGWARQEERVLTILDHLEAGGDCPVCLASWKKSSALHQDVIFHLERCEFAHTSHIKRKNQP